VQQPDIAIYAVCHTVTKYNIAKMTTVDSGPTRRSRACIFWKVPKVCRRRMQGQSPNPAPTRRECAGVPNATTSGMAQGQPKKPASQLAKSPKRRQTKLGKGCMPSQKAANIDRQAKVFKAKNTAIRKDQIKQSVCWAPPDFTICIHVLLVSSRPFFHADRCIANETMAD